MSLTSIPGIWGHIYCSEKRDPYNSISMTVRCLLKIDWGRPDYNRILDNLESDPKLMVIKLTKLTDLMM